MGTGESTSGSYDLKVRGWYRVARGAIGILLRVLSRLDVQGREEIPAHGAYILVTNHLHWLDSPVVAVILPHRAYVFAGEKWEKHWLLGPFFHSLGAIFVRRGEVDRQALRQALAVLQGGGVLGMAPEGTRSKTGGLQRGRTGAAYLAYRAGVPILPVTCTGQEKVFWALRRLRRATVRVRIGAPFYPPPVEGKASSAQVQAFTDEIMYRLAAMLPPEYRGVYRDVADQRPDLVQAYSFNSTRS
ncbi:MAG: 1-acyl-sn-glycerol-3-phosphate acyltransferase [Anaerolineaceae bacterium]|nr:1-acyl-sn-glycerol-3-phosphate acyltransferase [Anaerolineaceae bacterium]